MKCALPFLGFLLYLITASASGAPSNLSVPLAPAALLSLDTITLDTTICVGDSVQLQLPLSGATNIQWQPAAFLNCSNCPDPVTEALFGDQFFTATGLDGQGNPFSYEYNIYIRNYLDFGLLLFSNSPVCEGDTLVFNPNIIGAQSYTWTTPSSMVFTEAFPIIPNASQTDAGAYSLELIDELGCQAGATFDVAVHPAFTIDISVTGASCNGLCDGAISLDISGGTPPYQVSWDQGLNWSTSTTLSGLCTGVYPVWVMDENCLQKLEAVIEEADPLGASFNISSPNCPGDDIIIEIYNFTGGAGSGQEYFYSIDGGLTFQPTFDVQWQIPASTTSIVIRDDAGCQSAYPIVVTLPEPIRADLRQTNASCVALNNGSISIGNITGGVPPYNYYLNSILSAPLDNLAPGDYNLTLEDANGCNAGYVVSITTSPIDAITNDTVLCAGEQVQLQADAPGAVNIQWTPATGLSAPDQLTTTASPSISTTYVLNVEDDEGCVGADSVQVAVLPGLCREEWYDTLAIGQSGQWCSVASMFGSPIPYGITELGCGLGFVELDADSLATCINYRGLQPGQDTLCITICELLDTTTCWEAFLYLTVTENLVRPGDTDSSGMADQYDLLNIGLGYGATGPLRPNASLDWQGQPAPLWPQYTPTSGINYRHIDTNGDGLVSTADTLALSQNWGLTWEEDEGRPSGAPSPPAYRLDAPFYLQPDTLLEGAVMQLPLILGSEDAPATGVYGLAFSLYFDESVVKDGSAILVLADSWLGDPTQNLIYMQRLDDAAGRIDIGITRIDGLDAVGYGPIGDLFITIEDDILAFGRGFSLEARFEIRDVRVISYAEEIFVVDTPPTVSPVLTGLQGQPLSLRLSLSPNPASGFFYLHSQEVLLDEVQLLNVMGQPVRNWRNPKQGKPLSLMGIAPGLYLVKAQAAAGIGAWWLVVE